MSTLETTNLVTYREHLQQRAKSLMLQRAVGRITADYSDNVQGVSSSLDLLQHYHLSPESDLAKHLLKEAQFSLRLALEDLKSMDYLAMLHPHKQRFIHSEANYLLSQLRDLEMQLLQSPPFSPPSRSA
mgnify:CR=1 FL=1